MIPSKVIVHCSATPDYVLGNKSFDVIGAHQIDIWHRTERHWKMIGYHWVIRRTGVIEPGRPEDMIGAHCEGENSDSLGVCLVGTCKYTPDQIKSLQAIFLACRKRYGIMADKWFTHNHFNTHKTCPGFSMQTLNSIIVNVDIS